VPAWAGPDAQWTAWSTDTCQDQPGPAPDQAPSLRTADTQDGVVHLGSVQVTTRADGSCQGAGVEVFALQPVRLSVQCDPGVDVLTSWTVSPWTPRSTTPQLYEDAAVLELPYLGQGPYQAARLSLVRAEGVPGSATCELFLASQVAELQ